MKRVIHILLALTALLPALWGCQQKQPEAPVKIVDLRYRADDSYVREALSPEVITIVVSSTDPWTITTAHPEWSLIDIEEGEGSDPLLGVEGIETLQASGLAFGQTGGVDAFLGYRQGRDVVDYLIPLGIAWLALTLAPLVGNVETILPIGQFEGVVIAEVLRHRLLHSRFAL